jgi:hypothetical protein
VKERDEKNLGRLSELFSHGTLSGLSTNPGGLKIMLK